MLGDYLFLTRMTTNAYHPRSGVFMFGHNRGLFVRRRHRVGYGRVDRFNIFPAEF